MTATVTPPAAATARQQSIESALQQGFAPTELRVTNESGNHSVAPGSQTHFRVLVVSAQFEGRNRVARHRAVNKALAAEFEQGLHALAIDAWTPTEWAERGAPSVSPDCLGGSKHDQR